MKQSLIIAIYYGALPLIHPLSYLSEKWHTIWGVKAPDNRNPRTPKTSRLWMEMAYARASRSPRWAYCINSNFVQAWNFLTLHPYQRQEIQSIHQVEHAITSPSVGWVSLSNLYQNFKTHCIHTHIYISKNKMLDIKAEKSHLKRYGGKIEIDIA